MRDRDRLRAMRRMNEVQRARRQAAEAALGVAADAERDAAKALTEARRQTATAEQEWGDHLASVTFSPLYARHLAERMIGRASAEAAAEGRSERAGERRARAERDWQVSLAKVRLGEQVQQRLHRKVLRDRDEKRLIALADRTTWDWGHS